MTPIELVGWAGAIASAIMVLGLSVAFIFCMWKDLIE